MYVLINLTPQIMFITYIQGWKERFALDEFAGREKSVDFIWEKLVKPVNSELKQYKS